jgi:hypothetical protein
MNLFPAKILPPKFTLYIVLTEIFILNYVAEKLLLLFLKQFEYFQECVWVEIIVPDARNFLIGNHYLPLISKLI